MWKLFFLAVFLLPCSTLAQGISVPDCPTLGCNGQVVDPNSALTDYGGTSGRPGHWEQRVRGESEYDEYQPKSETCWGAVDELFEFVCDGDRQCAIEEAYDSKCLSSSANHDIKTRCVQVVGEYGRKCFGKEGCGALWDEIVGGCLVNGDLGDIVPPCGVKGSGDKRICSGAAVTLKRRDEVVRVMVTAPHCKQEKIVREGTVFRGLGYWKFVKTSRERTSGLDDINTSAPVYEIEDLDYNPKAPVSFPLGYASATTFVKTVFQGYNWLFASRNEVLSQVSVQGEKTFSPLSCDSSPLCTIVQFDGDNILHTCQSTRGGSGGALYQKLNGEWRIVAVNSGGSQGVVGANHGYRLVPD